MEHVAHLQRMANESWIGSPERAALDAAIASLSAQQPAAVDGALRAEVAEWKASYQQAADSGAAHASRAERLAEALRAVVADMREWGEPAKGAHIERIQHRLEDAMRDHDQEGGDA